MKPARISRLVQLLRLLQAGRGRNARELADECDVCRRTIFRDLDMLRSAGVPIEFDPQREKYSIPGKFFLPPTNFTTEEGLAVIALCQELGSTGRLPFYEAAHSAALKLQCSLPSQLRDQLRHLTNTIHIRPAAVNLHQGDKSYYDQLVDATSQRKAVRIRYGSLSESKTVHTKLFPYQLLFSRRSWYVIGRSSLHRQTRTFHLGRIESLEPVDETFKIPRGFSIERYLGNAWHLVPEPGPDHDVTVRFQPFVAQNVAEVQWHRTQQLQWNADGTLDMHVRVSGLGEIAWWILGYGDQAEVLEPPQLRERLTGTIGRMLSRYAESSIPKPHIKPLTKSKKAAPC